MKSTGSPAIDLWHSVFADRNLDILGDLIADDCTFHSPVVHTPQEGKDITIFYLSAAAQVLLESKFEYVREVIGEHDAMLEFTAEIDGVHLNGIDMIHWNADDRIDDFKVMVRPLKAVNLLHRMMGAMLEQMKSA